MTDGTTTSTATVRRTGRRASLEERVWVCAAVRRLRPPPLHHARAATRWLDPPEGGDRASKHHGRRAPWAVDPARPPPTRTTRSGPQRGAEFRDVRDRPDPGAAGGGVTADLRVSAVGALAPAAVFR